MRVLVTGASGFVGRATVTRLASAGHSVTAVATRIPTRTTSPSQVRWLAADLLAIDEFDQMLEGIGGVVHLAANAGSGAGPGTSSRDAYKALNVDVSLRLAQAAIRVGVGRFVFMSSIHVSGESSGKPFSEEQTPRPKGHYAESKLAAELALDSLTNLPLVRIRSPMVVGANPSGSLYALGKLIARGTPLPLGAIRNRRSLISDESLADFIEICLCHPSAPGELFLVAEGPPLSTPEIVRQLADALGKKPLLLPIPAPLLALAAVAVGQRDRLESLWGSLEVDSAKARRVLGWAPKPGVGKAISELARLIAASNGERDIPTDLPAS